MKHIFKAFLFAGLFSILSSASAQKVQSWLTNADQSSLFERQKKQIVFTEAVRNKKYPLISVNATKQYQSIDGFGFALTGGSASHLMQMSPNARKTLLQELFSTTNSNIGISYLRISIGASDLDEKVFSYDDVKDGDTDLSLTKFDLGSDKTCLIPLLKEILKINPKIKILGSPWSAPKWMKTNNDTRGGSLKPEYYETYAQYFVRYINEMQKYGIKIDAITVQNEPLHPGNNPSMYMPAPDQGSFVKKYLGPAFLTAKITTKIIIYDHNANRPDYPISILNDAEAKPYIDGSAFHLYEGKIDTLSTIHKAHPDKNLYFTEQWVGAPGNFREYLSEHISKLIIGATRNWCKNVILWNLTSNPSLTPHTDRGGCDSCLGGITLNGDSVTRNVGYYIIAHASKFVRPGSVRIGSNIIGDLQNVAFKNPDGQKILIVLNTSKNSSTFNISFNNKTATATLAAGSAGTFVWK